MWAMCAIWPTWPARPPPCKNPYSLRSACPRLVRLALLLLAALLVAPGCVVRGPTPRVPSAASEYVVPEALVPDVGVASALPDATPARAPIQASLRVAQDWLKPLDTVEAQLTAPAGTSVAWYVAMRGANAHVLALNSGTYVVADHQQRAPRRPTTGDIAPGGAPVSLTLDEPGLYAFGSQRAPGASLRVDVRPDAPAGSVARVFLVGKPGEVRFVPDEVTMRPGATLRVANQAEQSADATATSFLLLLPQRDPRVAFGAVDEGAYDLLAVVTDASGGRGEAGARFLVDFDRPVAHERIGPYSGVFNAPAAPPAPAESASWPLRAANPVRELRLAVAARSDMPAPASVELVLLRGQQEVARTSSADAEGIHLLDLPPGDYAIEARAAEGVLVAYTVEGAASYRLPPPPGL